MYYRGKLLFLFIECNRFYSFNKNNEEQDLIFLVFTFNIPNINERSKSKGIYIKIKLEYLKK